MSHQRVRQTIHRLSCGRSCGKVEIVIRIHGSGLLRTSREFQTQDQHESHRVVVPALPVNLSVRGGAVW